MNSPFLRLKKLIFRIFCELPAKMGSGSQYLCGFPDLTVEMRVARYRALTHFLVGGGLFVVFYVEMRVARYRALTHKDCTVLKMSHALVEMRVARYRALTLTFFCDGKK